MTTKTPMRALTIALFVTVSVASLELVAGLVFESLALTADAVHMFGDSAALTIALIAQWLTLRPASPRHSFGWRRAEVLGAQVNGLVLLAISLWIVIEAIRRFGDVVDTRPGPMLAVASVGLAANLFCTWILHRTAGHNLNVRAAALHTLSDAGASIGVLAAGLSILVFGWGSADAVASIFIALLVALAAVRLIGESTSVLLEATPKSVSVEAIETALLEAPAVVAVHHLHVWSLASDAVALSAHVEMEGPVTLHDAQDEAQRLKDILASDFGIVHATLELECHPCQPAEAVH